MTKIYVGIPCYNGSQTIEGVLNRVKSQNVAGIFIVNDGSVDDSLKILKKQKKIILLEHSENKGFGAAQKTLFDAFKKNATKHDWLVMIHSDGQTLPEEIPNFVKEIKVTSAQIILGSRMLKNRHQMSWFKKVGDKVLTGLQNWAYGLDLSTYASGFRAYSMNSLNLMDYQKLNDRHSFDSDIIVEGSEKGVKFGEIAVTPVYNDEVSNYNMIEYCFEVVKNSIMYKFKKSK